MHRTHFSARTLTILRRRLLRWFDRKQRDLPWRRDRDPYRIWVSEVMLQQTTTAAVVPRFKQFLKAFPTLADLAAADEQAVLRVWEGLGYYRRARHLHRAAQELIARHDGQLPDDPAVWASLPGVGRYILGAVLSQAFERRLPIVEANSLRVLCRLYGQRGDPHSGPVRKWLWQTAEALLPKRRIGDFNQALMELGALVCTPAAPQCGACPLGDHCRAKRDRLQERIPRRLKPATATEVREAAVVVKKADRVLLVRRPEHGRWAGLWEFPRGELKDGESPNQAGKRVLAELTGVTAKLGAELLTVRHSIMRYRVTLRCWEAEYRSGTFRSAFYKSGRWVRPAELARYPVSSPQRLLARAVAAGPRQRRLF